MQEVKAREGQLIGICTKGDGDVVRMCAGNMGAPRMSMRPPATRDDLPDAVEIPPAEPEVLPLLSVIPLQLLSYFMADLKGTDVDQPRNLAKTVTVE
jgi:glucosamine--fructose-6-phosphate aminotransferase (isomerizing)